MRKKSVVATALSMTVTALAGQAAYAQGSEADSIGLEEVVVTARKREESLQDVPLAVTALSAEQISDRQVQSIDDLARFTPGLVFAKAFGRSNDRPVIRGLASVLAGTNGTVETGAAYFVDGIYYPGDITSLDMADVARVEVIRGPQSALYGRNTYSGAVNFITRSPGDSFDGAASANFDKDEIGANLRLSGPLGEKAGGGVSMRYNKFDGQWVNQLTGKTIGSEESKSISGVLELTPTDDVTFRVRATWAEDRDGSRPLFFQSGGDNNCYPGLRSLGSYNSTSTTNTNQYFCGEIQPGIIALNDAPVTQSIPLVSGIPTTLNTAASGIVPTGGIYDTRQGLVFSGVNRDLALASAIGTWDIFGSGYTLTVDGGVREDKRKTGSDSDHSSVNIIRAPINGVQQQALGSATAIDETQDYSAEIKINSPEEARFRWLLGVYHYDQELRTFDMDFSTPNGQSEPWQIIDVTNTSFFGSVEFDFTDRLSASLELRRAKEYKQLNQRANRPNFQTPGATTFSGKDSWTASTPRVTVDFKLTPDITLFANFAKGTKPGGFNGATASNNGRPQDITFDEETSKNYEIGMKSAWMDNRLIANVSAFFLEATDIQLTTPIQSITTGAVTSIATNQGSGEIKGLELEARFAATENLTLGLTYALADTEFTEGCDDFQYTLTSGGGVYRSSAPATSFNPTGLGDCSIAGNPFPLAAKNTASFTADYTRPIRDGGMNLYVNGDVSFTDKRAVQVHDDPYTPSTTLVGLRVGVQTDKWRAGVYARNLTNEDAVPSATRWLHSYLIGINNVTLDPGLPPASIAGVGNASYSLPRGFFGILRRERQVGIEATYNLGGDSPAPRKVIDSDGDGVPDDMDRCPGTPAGTPVDANGCPLPGDADGDGVNDNNDRCPNTPAGARVDSSGCELDADGDGVVDRLDQCPSTPAGAKVNASGCELDSDGDGVVDSKDRCPDTPAGDRVDVNGCSFKEELKLPGVVFETNKAELLADSSPTLNDAVATLKRYPDIKVEVAGHTDSVGSDAYNRRLSQSRAETVMAYLKNAGVTNELTAKGYGEKTPIADNKTEEGRQANRRVVLRIK